MGLAITLLIAGALCGGAMSVVPRSDREVTREIDRPGTIPRETIEMQMVERSRGLPFRTWVVQSGPVGAPNPEHVHFEVRLSAALLNVAFGAVLGVLMLLGLRRRDTPAPPT
jgi:hypothetical protein